MFDVRSTALDSHRAAHRETISARVCEQKTVTANRYHSGMRERCEISRGSHRSVGSVRGEERTRGSKSARRRRARSTWQRGKAACFLLAMIGKKRRVNERSAWWTYNRGQSHTDDDISPPFPADGRWRPYLERNDVIVFRSSSQVQIYRRFLAELGGSIRERADPTHRRCAESLQEESDLKIDPIKTRFAVARSVTQRSKA